MEYNEAIITIGKVRNFDNVTGEIVSKEGTFNFNANNISDGETITNEDVVLFRGEQVHGVPKAFFIKRINPDLNLQDQIYQKTKSKKPNERE